MNVPTAPAGSWPALGTYVQVRLADDARQIQADRRAAQLLDDVDRSCSRFRADSDLTRANANAGRWVRVSPVLVGALRVALDAAAATDGLVDPTLGRVLSAAGYDRSFELIDADGPASVCAPELHRFREVGLEPGAVRVPGGVALDLGGTGKAFAADLVAGALAGEFGCDVVVSVGGDLRVCGADGGEASWPVQVAERVEDLDDDSRGQRVQVSGGLATSSTTARRWSAGGRRWTHIIDPRTALPAAGQWRTVSAVGATCAAANTASLASIVLGARAPQWLGERGVSARLVDADGAVTVTGGWPSAVEKVEKEEGP